MLEDDISKALREHLETMTGIPSQIVYENKDPGELERPRLVLQMVRTGKDEDTLDGEGKPTHFGYLQVTIVNEIDSHSFPSEALGDAIAAHFPRAKKLAGASGGSVKVEKVTPGPVGFRDGPDWRYPVKIFYRAA